ncbi:MAG: prolyl oligopeptidase family serine peptidase [Fibrobacter sp.]|nr:prolyl oligopeptidase family serine peptidase [Fibrobacter sp.]
MTMSKFMAFAGSIAALSSLSFAWSISGGVFSNLGEPLPGVKIVSTNYPGIDATTTDSGAFSITGTDALRSVLAAKASVKFSHNVISISGFNAQTITVSVMDALGKVAYSKTIHNMHGSASFDLNKSSARGAKFLRINADGNHNTYKLGEKVTLLKEGDPMPILNFSKEGFKSLNYTMQSEVEVDVYIRMQPGESVPTSSSAITDPTSSSAVIVPASSATEPASSSAVVPASSETVSSSSKADVIDCSTKTLKSNTSISVGGRKVIIDFPNGYKGDTPTPMLINYHQIMGSADSWRNESKTAKAALADGAIVVFPDGAQSPDMGQAWNIGPCCTDADDIQFTRDIIKELTAQACVDPKRVYVAGWSMGGGMANYAGCLLADVVAAGASSAFDLTKEVLDAGQCNPARPYPILNFRSTNDGVVNYNGGFSQIVSGKPLTFLGAKETFKKWAELDGCTGEPKQNTPSAGCETYDSCQGGVKVVLCSQNIDHNEGDAQIGWEFVKQFSLP